MPNLTSIRAGATKAAFGDVFKAQLDELSQFINNKAELNYKTHGFQLVTPKEQPAPQPGQGGGMDESNTPQIPEDKKNDLRSKYNY